MPNKPNNRYRKGVGSSPTPSDMESSDSIFGRIPPQVPEMEMAVLGAIMLDRNAYAVVDWLSPEHFYKDSHQTIYQAMQTLASQNKTIDLLTVCDILESQNHLEEVGGRYYIAQLTNSVASATNIEYHARVVHSYWRKRQLVNIGGLMEASAFDVTEDPDDIIERAQSELVKITTVIDVDGLDPKIKEALDAIAGNASSFDVTSGFKDLDKLLGCFHKGGLYVVGAYPGVGKTTFLLNMVRHQLESGKKVLFYSTDKPQRDIVTSMLSNMADVEVSKLHSGQLSPEEREKVNKASATIQQSRFLLADSRQLRPSSINVVRLIRRAWRLGAKIAYIDCLHGIDPWDKSSEYERLTALMNRLKLLSMELDMPIVVTSTLNRRYSEYRGEGHRPTLKDLSGSGAIEAISTSVLFMHRPEYFRIYEDEKGNDLRGQAFIIVAKNGYGSVGEVQLRYREYLCRYCENDDYIKPTVYSRMNFPAEPSVFDEPTKKGKGKKTKGFGNEADAPF